MNKTRYIPEGYTRDNITSYVDGEPKNLFEVYTRKTPYVAAIFYTGKQSKATWHYKFSDEGKMVEKIRETIDKLISWEKRKAERKVERKAPHTLKVGDILYSSWGYDQTNVDFYQVTKVISNRTVEIREIGGKLESGDMGSDRVTAIKDAFLSPRGEYDKTGLPMIKRVNSSNTISLSSYSSAWLWDGKPKYQTALGWGH